MTSVARTQFEGRTSITYYGYFVKPKMPGERERERERTMTSNTTFADVKVGDRVRLTGNGEVHEFTAGEATDSWIKITESGHMYYWDNDWQVEILPKPLPTGEYAVIGSRKDPENVHGFYFEGGKWRNHDGEHSQKITARAAEYWKAVGK